MFGVRKSPLKTSKHNSVDPGHPERFGSNPFDSDDEVKDKRKHNSTSRRTSSEPALVTPESRMDPFGDNVGSNTTSSYAFGAANRNKYKNDFRDSGGIENQSVQELENYAVYKAEETTKQVNNCLKIAEEIRGDATKTLVALHEQGEQINRTHHVAADIDHDLSRGEKLLGSLGGMFSKTWKPKKTRPITGPVISGDDSLKTKGSHLEQREKLGLTPASRERSKSHTSLSESASALEKVEVEKLKQDDSLSDISSLLGELKGMAVDMGSEIDRHNKALDHLYNDVDELNIRVEGANQRGRHLLQK